MSNRRALGSVGLLVAAGLLAGCATGNYVYDLKVQDLVGTWSATGDLRTSVTLSGDGTFTAEGWPDTLWCNAPAAENVADLADASRLTLSGTWRYNEGSAGSILPSVNLTMLKDVCVQGDPGGYLWRDGEGRVSWCIPVPLTDPDNFVRSDTVAMLREADSGGASKSCF